VKETKEKGKSKNLREKGTRKRCFWTGNFSDG